MCSVGPGETHRVPGHKIPVVFRFCTLHAFTTDTLCAVNVVGC